MPTCASGGGGGGGGGADVVHPEAVYMYWIAQCMRR